MTENQNSDGGPFSPEMVMAQAGDSLPPREKIVLAAILTVQVHGLEGATTRRITKLAGVNVAAVNYYFGSKDKLLEAAFDQTLHEGFTKALAELKECVEHCGGDVKQGTLAFLTDYIANAFRYPRIAVAHVHDALMDQDYSGPAVRHFQSFLKGFSEIVTPAMPQADETEKRLAIIHVWTSIFHLALMPGLFDEDLQLISGPRMAERFWITLFNAPR